MTLDIYFKDTRNNNTLTYHYDCEYTQEEIDDKTYDFIWTEGNYSCDCNRSIFMYGLDSELQLKCNVDKNIILIEKICCHETGDVLEERLHMLNDM